MRILVQRVKKASVVVDGQTYSQIAQGYLLLVGIDQADNDATVRKMAAKVQKLRVMSDHEGRMNLALTDTKGELLVVSQFTLIADARQNRPSFIKAARPEKAKPLFDLLVGELSKAVKSVKTGRFGHYMDVNLVNDGPVTIWLDSNELF